MFTSFLEGRSCKGVGAFGQCVATSVLFLSFLVFAGPPVAAQVYTGSLTGVVADPTGAVIPKAGVTLVDTVKGFTYNTATDDTGRYILRNLAPSAYTLKVEAQGFKEYIQSGITLTVQQNATVDVALQMGATTSQVNVTAAAPLLQPHLC